MKDPDSEAGVLAVLNELAEVSQAALLGLWVFLDDGDDRVRNRRLVFLEIKNEDFEVKKSGVFSTKKMHYLSFRSFLYKNKLKKLKKSNHAIVILRRITNKQPRFDLKWMNI